MIINLNYGDKFLLEQGKVYQFPDFTLEYLGDYQDPVPESFPNQESGLFRGRRLKLKSVTQEKEVKESYGTGIVTPLYFAMGKRDFSLGHTTRTDQGFLRYLVEGKLPLFNL